MFGTNEIVGKSYFKDAKDDELFITSMFQTLQGEGPFAGCPAFFIRLTKCNLACGFCDTFFDDGDWLTFNDIEQKIEETINNFYESKNSLRPLWTYHNGNRKKDMVLVITGGEPSLQNNLSNFLNKMQNVFKNTQIESNGILYLNNLPNLTTLVVSPKCLEKNNKAIKYIQPNKKVLERADCLKFVMCADFDSPYSSIPDWAHDWKQRTGKEIYISPMNIYNDLPQKAKELRNSGKNRIEIKERSTIDEVISFWDPGLLNMKDNQKNHEYAAQYCVEHGLRLNLQIHLFASLA